MVDNLILIQSRFHLNSIIQVLAAFCGGVQNFLFHDVKDPGGGALVKILIGMLVSFFWV